LSSFLGLVLDLFVVALGGHGRGAVLGQHHHIGGGGLRAVERREIDAGLGGAVVGGGEEVEVLAVGVEGRAEASLMPSVTWVDLWVSSE
jgi:hypothetical protein